MSNSWSYTDLKANFPNIKIVTSWDSAVTCLSRLDHDDKFDRQICKYLFRGTPAPYRLRTALQLEFSSVQTRNSIENVLIRNFKKYAAKHVSNQYESDWEWLALARHYRLPTRLLDWTGSWLVAMYFATYSNFNRINVGSSLIWCLNHDALRCLLPRRLQNILLKHNARSFTVEMLTEAGITSPHQLELYSRQPFALIIDPPVIDQRIAAQASSFLVFSKRNMFIDEWLATEPVRRYVQPVWISKCAKRDISIHLIESHVTHMQLFPGLEGVAVSLTRRYQSLQDLGLE